MNDIENPDEGIEITQEEVLGSYIVTFSFRPSESLFSKMLDVWKNNGYRYQTDGRESDGRYYVILKQVKHLQTA